MVRVLLEQHRCGHKALLWDMVYWCLGRKSVADLGTALGIATQDRLAYRLERSRPDRHLPDNLLLLRLFLMHLAANEASR
jgi:hypothetical protein